MANLCGIIQYPQMITLSVIVAVLLLVLIIERGQPLSTGTLILIVLLILLVFGTGYSAYNDPTVFHHHGELL